MSTTSAHTTDQARALLAAAQRGDEGAFGRLVEPHRRELHAHCYRMLGSVHDGEDALQEALLRAWRGLSGFEGFSAREVADSLETTVASINSSLQRARKALDAQLPEQSQQTTLRALGEVQLSAIVRSYMDAMERADVPAVIALLTEDATWSMPPYASWFRGLDDIDVFLRSALAEGWRHVPTHANGQLAVGCYSWSAERECYVPAVVDVLTLRGARITGVTGFVTSELFPSFGLPPELPR